MSTNKIELKDSDAATIKKINEYLDKQLQNLREQNDSVTNDFNMTNVIRGEIKALKSIRKILNPERPKHVTVHASRG